MRHETYEEALYSYLKEELEVNISKHLGDYGRWNGEFALFYQNTPRESDHDWEGVQYPQIIYDVDWQSEPERLKYGKLNIWINTVDKTVEPVVIGELIRKALKGVFFNTRYSVYSQSWISSELYEYEGERPLIRGTHLIFDVLAFPDQRTYLNPDPVVGLNHYIKSKVPDALVIGLDEMPDVLVTGREKPEIPDGKEEPATDVVIFLRTIDLTNAGKDTKVYRWTNYRAALHVVSSDYLTMRRTLGWITQSVMVDGETPFFDDRGRLYQLRFTDDGENLVVSYQTGELLEGQILLSTEFALLNLPPKIPGALQPSIGEIEIEEIKVERKGNQPEYWCSDVHGEGDS